MLCAGLWGLGIWEFIVLGLVGFTQVFPKLQALSPLSAKGVHCVGFRRWG